MNEVSLICKYISEHPGVWKQELEERSIRTKIDGNLAIFNYGLDCDFSDPLVQEARGIIINLSNLEVVCFPFRKFGNFGESYADTIDWDFARVQEKVDGSIMKVYFYDGKWRVATNGTIDAYYNDGNYIKSGRTFGVLFDEGAEDAGLDYSVLDPEYTYIFELVSPDCPIVLKYPKTTIYHLGTRNNKTGEEVCVDIGVKKPKEYHLNSLEECIESAKMMNENAKLDELNGEGYVVVDKNWHRVKVKSPDYLKAHYCNAYNNPTDRRLVLLIRSGDAEEICTYFPAFQKHIDRVQERLDNLKKVICKEIQKYEDDAKILPRYEFFKKYSRDRWGKNATSYYYNDSKSWTTLDEYVTLQLHFYNVEKLIQLYNEFYQEE